ncbi:MAG: hypothetical protein BWY85_01346 [Firmicutes bacterium ADurb.Bin506]|nr:MAG: hypothetical protein BWY85_01346 [Firmicutes bacterium ADurb.Bin506]
MAKTNRDQVFRLVGLEPRRSQSGVYDRGEVAVGDVRHTGPRHQTRCEDPPDVVVFRLLDAVRRHHDGPGELLELRALVLPRAAVVAHEVRIFPQLRIAVGRQHLAVGVYIDALALGLLENGLQITQVMP